MNAGRRSGWTVTAGRLALCVALLTGAGSSVAAAQAPAAADQSAPPASPPDTGLGQTQQDPARLAPPASVVQTAPAAPPAAAACPFAGQNVTVTLTAVEALGATELSPEAVNAAVSELLNRPQDLGVICEIRDRVAALYASRGLRLTRVELPEQRIGDGVLRLRVTEGRVAEVRLANPEGLGPSAPLAKAYLDQLKTGEPAVWADVERAVQLVREIPGVDVNIQLAPSASAPGAVDVQALFGERHRFDLLVGVQHLGSKELGETAVLARGDANSFTPWGERTSLVLFSTTTGAQQVIQVLEEVRLGGSGLLGTADIAFGRTKPEGDLSQLKIEGEALIGRLGVNYPWLGGRVLALSTGARFDYVDQQNDLASLGQGGGSVVFFEDKLRVFMVDADLRWRPEALPGLEMSLGGELRQGVDGLGASQAGDRNLSRSEGRPDFFSARGRAAVRFEVSPTAPISAFVSLLAEGQWADGPLLAYEEYQIGNYSIGRGYDPGAAAGDIAYGGRLELGLRFNRTLWGMEAIFEPFAFADAAQLKNEDAGGYDSDITSFGGGVRVSLNREYDLSVAYAVPQSEPFPTAQTPDPRVLVQLTRRFRFR